MLLTNTQTAAWLDHPHHGATLTLRNDILIPEPLEGEVLVKLECSGFCHSDVHSIYGETPMETNIAGHEGVGRVVKLGKGVSSDVMGKLVGVKWVYSACGECEICKVRYVHCPHQNNSGRNVPGTFQQYVVSPLKYTTIVPEGLEPEIVAPLLCAGVTVYAGVTQASKFITQGDTIVILGAGGGLGHLAVQVASVSGYRVIAVDSGDKADVCMTSGASEFVDFLKQDVEQTVKGLTGGIGAHAVMVTAGSEKAYESVPKLLRNLGILVCVGIPRLDFHVPISPFEIIVRGLKIVGTSVGTESDVQELLKLTAQGKIKPQIEVYDFNEINDVIGKLAKFQVKGRAVLRLPQ
ncbi:GroES-like protein [Trichoderma camerunense]